MPLQFWLFILGHVRLYIWKMHPDGPSRCLIQMLHLGVVRFFIFVCFSFFNLHLYPGGLVNKMTKIYFFIFWRKNNIFTVLAENIAAVFEKNVFLTKSAFLCFWRKNTFCGIYGKCVFDEKMCFFGFDGKSFFAILVRKCIFAVLAENAFLRF